MEGDRGEGHPEVLGSFSLLWRGLFQACLPVLMHFCFHGGVIPLPPTPFISNSGAKLNLLGGDKCVGAL